MPIDFEPIEETPKIDFEPMGEPTVAAPEPETDSWAEVVGNSVMQGLTFIPTSIGATSRFVNDLLGLDFFNRPGDLYDISKEAANFWEPKTEGSEAKRHTANIIRTMGEMGSAAALAIPTGGTAALLPTIAVGAGAQKFAEARAEGTEFTTAASAGLLQGEIEFLTEKAPLGILLKPGLSFGRRLAMGLVTDIPGELMATAGEMSIVDTQYLGKRYTLDQYLQALKDTAITAAGVTGGMTAISHPFIKQVEEFQEQAKREPEKYEEIFTGGIKAMTEGAPAEAAPEAAETDIVDFRPEPIQDLTTEEAATVEASTIEIDEVTERAVTELISEGVELDAITDDAIQAKIETLEQAPISPVDETAIPEAGVEGEARATSFVGSEAGKRIITDEMYQGALKAWKEKTSGVLRSGIDPTMLAPLVTMGAYHVESGIKTFAKWSEKMVEEFGDKVKPHLKDIWKQSQDYLKAQVPVAEVKGQVRRATGIQRAAKLIREDVALRAAWKKAEQSARIAFREGKKEEAAKWREKMVEVLAEAKERAAAKIAKIRTEKQKIAARRKQINDIVEWLGLNDLQVKKLVKKDIRLMTDFEFMKFKADLLVKAEEMQEKAFEKARLREIIESKRLQKVENYRRVLGYPTIDGMTTEQLRDFADTLEEFQDGDVFLTERELEVVDRTDLKDIKTWREAKEALAKELETTPDKLDTIKPSNFDMMRWDASLAEQNPFYGLLVETTTKHLMNAEARYHEIENRIFELARKSEKSRKRTLTEKLIPQDKQIFEYLEAPTDMKAALAEQMTPEQLDLARYMQEYFGQALEYLIKTKSLEKGRENYFVHMRRSFLETFKEDGLVSAVLSVFRNYQQDEVVFNILDDDTGNILPLEKFFQFSMRRTGALEPTQNVVKAFLTYTKTFEKKVTLDEIIPKFDIYAQSLTPQTLTPRGLETDRSLKKFVNRYINNKKGRQISFDSFIKQGGPIDLSIRAVRTFTTMMDLGLSIPVGVAAFVGERVANFQLLGARGFALGEKRSFTTGGKAILKKYEHFTGRSVWEEFTAPGKEVTERLMQGMFGLFHQATVSANKQFLLGMMTEGEFKKGEIGEDRLTELKIEMGRWRVVPGAKSIIGSTSVGGAAVQYKSWAVVMGRTTVKDLTTLLGDLKNKPTGEALTTKEARELYRAVGLIAAVLIVAGAGDDEEDKSFTGQLLRRIRNESLSILSAISPDMWLATPRIIGFMTQLGKNLTAIIKLEEYKTKPGLKGVGGLKRQLTPGTVRQLTSEEDTNKPRARVQ